MSDSTMQNPVASSSTTSEPLPPVKSLILDAGPLLSLSPLRGLASRYLTVPLVLSELRDPTARTHWENLKLMSGVEVTVREPDALSMSRVTAWARYTGDLSVLSKADLNVLALTYALEVEENGFKRIRTLPGEAPHPVAASSSKSPSSAPSSQSPAPTASTSDAPTPQTAPKPPPKSPWGAVPKAAAFDLSSQPAQALEEGEEGWAEDAEAEQKEMMEAMNRMEIVEGSDDESEGGDEDEELDGEDAEQADSEQAKADSPESADPAASSPVPTASAVPTSSASTSEITAPPQTTRAQLPKQPFQPVYAEAESASDDSEGEWITPTNVLNKKAVDMGLAPPSASVASTSASASNGLGTTTSANAIRKAEKKAKKRAAIAAASGLDGADVAPRTRNHKMKSACMTGDYAVQNVLLQMGFNLVGEEGKRIEMVKSWVLRCHACFKICKDPAKKFCPSCGNASLIRASVTTSIDPITQLPTQKVHLKSNFQYRTRGTKYSIPDPKMGSAKGQQRGGSGLILREDQREYQLGVRKETIRREKEERKLDKAVKAMEEGKGGGTGSWNDPDWMPEILVVGLSGKGRQGGGDFLPQIGHGRRNPNQVKRGKK